MTKHDYAKAYVDLGVLWAAYDLDAAIKADFEPPRRVTQLVADLVNYELANGIVCEHCEQPVVMQCGCFIKHVTKG